jgi:hypothetical protein
LHRPSVHGDDGLPYSQSRSFERRSFALQSIGKRTIGEKEKEKKKKRNQLLYYENTVRNTFSFSLILSLPFERHPKNLVLFDFIYF